jgi:hypothetical protein
VFFLPTIAIDVQKNRVTQLRAGTLNLQGFLLNLETFKVLETLKVFD